MICVLFFMWLIRKGRYKLLGTKKEDEADGRAAVEPYYSHSMMICFYFKT